MCKLSASLAEPTLAPDSADLLEHLKRRATEVCLRTGFNAEEVENHVSTCQNGLLSARVMKKNTLAPTV